MRKRITLFFQRRLWRLCRRRFRLEQDGEHGPAHWQRVAAFGELLHEKNPKVDVAVVRAFACLHDVERMDNGDDLNHGPRAARLAMRIRRLYLPHLSDNQAIALYIACEIHTSWPRLNTVDYADCRRPGSRQYPLVETVNACLDADRLDLVRCGAVPNPERMASPEGAALAAREDFVEAVWMCIRDQVSSIS